MELKDEDPDVYATPEGIMGVCWDDPALKWRSELLCLCEMFPDQQIHRLSSGPD